ncbi:acetyl-CoA carboxylase biotin carboxyl carrier protein [Paenibacillus allorhizosphaerae]|uniref:Biotin carboxyl carrier protein of acetyl-CoA carboxylase n=1 Tax=Paenibacillus allorhizosphaerae TaxID=2849866 RepID=A0ABN7TN13_9BACL|nr:acetyl-CoA carboxylase biotin carboxyl carrier protein [Paenibacillus allorhizosphaerae]CAG7642234.1 Biotin carboxyl carrier protein of acetyl-CoA carboxylase [Paenibacillus allorhizosphaerae]
MFKLSEIKELIKLVDQTSLQELEIESEGSRLLIRKPNKTEQVIVASGAVSAAVPQVVTHQVPAVQAVQAPAAETVKPEPASNLHTIVSPMVGTFYEAPSPGAAAFVSKGSDVKEKTVVCIIEAMKLMNEIEAEVKGEIVEVLVENGQLVEFGQPLFTVKPE